MKIIMGIYQSHSQREGMYVTYDSSRRRERQGKVHSVTATDCSVCHRDVRSNRVARVWSPSTRILDHQCQFFPRAAQFIALRASSSCLRDCSLEKKKPSAMETKKFNDKETKANGDVQLTVLENGDFNHGSRSTSGENKKSGWENKTFLLNGSTA